MAWTIALGIGLAQTALGAAATTNPVELAHWVQEDLAQLAARMGDESARQEDRDEAARRLIARDNPTAHATVVAGLESANRNTQLAACRALARDPKPDAAIVPVLFRLLGTDRALTEAAAQALGTFRDDQTVVARLEELAGKQDEKEMVRVGAIQALGGTASKKAAETLIAALSDTTVISNAASDALVEMTGLRENAHDLSKWRSWWGENGNLGEGKFRELLVNSQAGRLDRVFIRKRQLEEEVASVLSDQYQLAPDSQKPDLLLRYLRSSEPAIRTTGARLVIDDAVNNRTIPPAALEQLRGMIGDSSPDVRVATSDALRAVNDTAAIPGLLTQLAQETDEQVRASIARALVASTDLQALGALRHLLHDPAPNVAQAAADTIRELGPKIRDVDPGAVTATAEDLREILDQPTGDTQRAGEQSLRESLVMAMAALGEPKLLPVYYRLLRGQESSGIRRAAVKGIGELRLPEAADAVANLLDDPDATVRLEAVDALAHVGSFQDAELLYSRTQPGNESDASVRDHAWRVLAGLFPSAPIGQLSQWAARLANQPERRLVVLMALADDETKAGKAQAEPLAYTEKAIGETLLSLSRPADAVKYLRQSLDFWKTREPRGMTMVGLTQELLTALLRSKQYPAAAAFGGELLAADVSNQQTVGPAMREEAQRLMDANDLVGASALIGEAQKMTPAMDARYVQSLSEMEQEIRRRSSEAQ